MRSIARRGVGWAVQPDYGDILDAESVYGRADVLEAYQDQAGIFGDIANIAAQGSNQIGAASEFLLRAGYTVEAIRNAFNNIAAVAAAPTPEVELAANELRYLNNTARLRDSSSGIWIALGIGALFILATRRND